MTFRKTPVAAREVPCTYTQLISLIRYGKIDPPARDTSGDFVWLDEDIERARQALAAKRKGVPA